MCFADALICSPHVHFKKYFCHCSKSVVCLCLYFHKEVWLFFPRVPLPVFLLLIHYSCLSYFNSNQSVFQLLIFFIPACFPTGHCSPCLSKRWPIRYKSSFLDTSIKKNLVCFTFSLSSSSLYTISFTADSNRLPQIFWKGKKIVKGLHNLQTD